MPERSNSPSPSRRGRGLGGVVVAVAILGAVAFFGLRRAGGPAEAPKTLEERYAEDDRVRPLLFPCAEGRAFEGDTSSMIEVLVAKLDAGAQREPMQRARQELATLGPEVEPPLRRLFDEATRDVWRVPVVLNVLDVCALAEEPWGLEIGVRGMLAAREDVRARASYVLRKHGGPEQYAMLKEALFAASTPEVSEKYAMAMKTCDLGQFTYDAPDFIDRMRVEPGGWAPTSLADLLAAEVVAAVDPILVERLYLRSEGLAPRQRAYMIAPAAASADSPYREAAREELRALLRDELVGPRQHAAHALAAVGLAAEVLPVLELDQDARLRAIAATLVGKAASEGRLDPAQAVPALRAGMNDPDEGVAAECLGRLLLLGDEVAWADALRKLDGSIAERDVAVRTLRPAWDVLPPEAPDQARARLLARWQRGASSGAPGGELISVLVALGAVPGRATGEALLAIAADLVGKDVRGIDGFRWCVGQVFNAGPAAQAVLRERLASEADPFRRLDLISFVWSDEHPDALEVLLAIVSDDTRSPYERLYVADRLVQMRHSVRVAPVLKAVYWESTDPVLRPALHCLLWNWYGVSSS